MKAFIKSTSLFCLYAALVYLVLLVCSGTFLPLYLRKNLYFRDGGLGHMYSRMKDVKTTGQVYLLFLGSSHAYRGFDSRIFEKYGYTSFNLGSSGQTPLQSLMLLEKYLDRLHPKWLVLEVYPEVFCMDGVESSLDVLSNEEVDIHSVKMIGEINHVMTYNTFLYSSFVQFAGMGKNYQQLENEGKDHYLRGKGFVAREMEYFKHINHEPASCNCNATQLKAFDKIIALLKNKHVNYFLVEAPITNALFNSKTNNSTADSLFNSKGKFVNFNTKLQLDDSLDFYDAGHLNQQGVDLFDEAFIAWMKKQ